MNAMINRLLRSGAGLLTLFFLSFGFDLF